jgi:hypothetical protein
MVMFASYFQVLSTYFHVHACTHLDTSVLLPQKSQELYWNLFTFCQVVMAHKMASASSPSRNEMYFGWMRLRSRLLRNKSIEFRTYIDGVL